MNLAFSTGFASNFIELESILYNFKKQKLESLIFCSVLTKVETIILMTMYS